MTLFLTLVGSWVVAGIIMSIVTKRILGTTTVADLEYLRDSDGYTRGYNAGIGNLKMYYYSIGEMPDTTWLDKVKAQSITTRERLDLSLTQK